MGSNRQNGLTWRNSVLGYLHDRGFTGAHCEANTMNPNAALPGNSSIIVGLPFSITTRREHGVEMSTAINVAHRHATERGQDVYASVIFRHGYGVQDAYALMPFCVWLDTLERLHPPARSVSQVGHR